MSAAMIADRVVIIGGGPVGMMLALNLAALGVKSTLINRETGPRWHPKGSTQNARTMEHYRRLGIVDAVRAGQPEVLTDEHTREAKRTIPVHLQTLYPGLQKRWDAGDNPWGG